MRKSRKIFTPTKLILYALLIVFATRALYYAATEGFCPERITASSYSLPNTESSLSQTQDIALLKEISKTPFRYLKKGSQAYAFESTDHKYVLKLFKRHHMQDPVWLEKIPSFGPLAQWKKILLEKRRKRLHLSLASYILATTRLQKQCAIIAYQLEPSFEHTLPCQLIDGIGRHYIVDLARCGYVLQRKATLIFPTLESWINQQDQASCRKALASIIELIAYRSKLGIHDVDPDLHKNAGLLGTEAMFIDIGSFTDQKAPLSKESFEADIRKTSKELRSWLATKDPQLASYLDETIQEAIRCYTHND